MPGSELPVVETAGSSKECGRWEEIVFDKAGATETEIDHLFECSDAKGLVGMSSRALYGRKVSGNLSLLGTEDGKGGWFSLSGCLSAVELY